MIQSARRSQNIKQDMPTKSSTRPPRGSPLIWMLGNHHHPKMKIDMPSPEQANKIIEVASERHINIASNSFTLRSPDIKGTLRATGDQGTPYEAAFETTWGTLYKEVSPLKMHENEPIGRILFSETSPRKKVKIKKDLPTFFDKSNKFSFLVRATDIKKSRKRACTQKKAVGISAQNALQRFGAKIHKKKGRGSHYHLAHRQGHALGGSQSANNLDLATAGANYTLLFYMEDPIHQLMSKENIDYVTVEGGINYHLIHEIPESIDYIASFPQGTQCKKRINLFEYRIPSVDENIVANLMLEKGISISSSPQNLEIEKDIPEPIEPAINGAPDASALPRRLNYKL